MTQKWISVEGIIGAGKTTLLKGLSNLAPNTVLVEEPVKLWQDSGILQDSYENPEVWSFPAQTTFFTSRINIFRERHADAPADALFVSERSAFSDILFWNTHRELGLVTPKLHNCYLAMWNMWQHLLPIQQPDLFVFLQPDLDECMKRMRKRGRDEEKNVDVEYQQALYEQHVAKFMDPEGVLMPNGDRVPCLVVDGNSDFCNDPVEMQRIVDQIKTQLK